MKKLLLIFTLMCKILFAFDFQKDFGLLEWKSSERLINIVYEGLVNDLLYADNHKITVLSHYDYGIDIERISFYLYENQLYKVEVVYNPSFANLTYVEGKVKSMEGKYGIYSKEVINEKIGFLYKRGEILKWAKGPTLISLSGIDLLDELGTLQDSQFVETHEYYPISNQI